MAEPLHVLTLADERFALPLAVLLRSSLDHLSPGARLDVTVVDGGIQDATRARIEASAADPRLRVEWRPPPADLVVPRLAGRIPPLTFARLLVPSLVPPDCTRAVVLDADQLVLTDLDRLAREALSGALALAPRDPFIPFVSSPNGLAGFEALGLSPRAPYFAGAMMVVDVPAWRRERVAERALQFVAEHARELRSYDQDAINAVLAGRIRELDARWQVQPRALALSARVTPHLDAVERARLRADPWVVHFSGRLKPWLYEGRSAFDARYREVVERTAFRGQPPPRNARAALFRLYDGWLRRTFYPLELAADSALRARRRRALGRSAVSPSSSK
jgi:lipopolysaccharide biosynthesis glycosyltransferase